MFYQTVGKNKHCRRLLNQQNNAYDEKTIQKRTKNVCIFEECTAMHLRNENQIQQEAEELIRTDTIVDLSQKADKGRLQEVEKWVSMTNACGKVS